MSLMNLAVIKDDVVINIVVVEKDSGWFPPDGCEIEVIDSAAPIGIGWTRVDGVWIAPPRPEE